MTSKQEAGQVPILPPQGAPEVWLFSSDQYGSVVSTDKVCYLKLFCYLLNKNFIARPHSQDIQSWLLTGLKIFIVHSILVSRSSQLTHYWSHDLHSSLITGLMIFISLIIGLMILISHSLLISRSSWLIHHWSQDLHGSLITGLKIFIAQSSLVLRSFTLYSVYNFKMLALSEFFKKKLEN